MKQGAIDYILGMINSFIGSGNTGYLNECLLNGGTLEECNDENIDFVRITNGMDKKCQASEIFRSVYKINSPFTNKMRDYFLLSNDNNLNIQDLATGETMPNVPEMPAGIGARVLPVQSVDGTIILQFNNTHLDTATTLGFINTFYHELVHAYLLHLYYNGELINEYPDYTELEVSMINFFADIQNTDLAAIYDKAMHDVYVDFIDDIAEAIISFCNYNNIVGVNLEYAKKLVWGGLNGNDIFYENLTPVEQNETQTLLAYENSNTTASTKGTKTCE